MPGGSSWRPEPQSWVGAAAGSAAAAPSGQPELGPLEPRSLGRGSGGRGPPLAHGSARGTLGRVSEGS